MKAFVKKDETVKFYKEDVPIPEPKPDEALVKVINAGLCGTDIAIRNNTFIGRHGPVKPPVIPGHELCGEVVEIGSKVTKVSVGDRVITSDIKGCGKCYACKTRVYNRCHNWDHVGIDSPGCFAEYVAISEEILFQVPDSISSVEAAVFEPLTTAVRAFRTNDIKPGSFIVVLGPGPFGLFIMQAALASGPRSVVMVGLSSDEERLQLAKELGAEYTIKADQEDPVERILELTKGEGADVVIEATGNVEAVRQGIEMTGAGGLFLMGGSGFKGKEIHFKPWNVVRDEKRIKGLQGLEWADYLLALELHALGKIKVKPVISQVMNIDRINEACDLIEAKRAIKIVFEI